MKQSIPLAVDLEFEEMCRREQRQLYPLTHVMKRLELIR